MLIRPQPDLELVGEAGGIADLLAKIKATESPLVILEWDVLGQRIDTLMDLLRSADEIDAFRVGDSTASWAIKADVTNHRVFTACPNSTPADGTLQNNQVVFYQSSGNLAIKMKDNSGTVTSGTVTLS